MSEILAYPLDQRVVVEASAGTGKTYTLSYLFLRFILEKEIPIQQILVVTFTEAATQELYARVRQQLKMALKIVDGHTEAYSRTDLDNIQAIFKRCQCDPKAKLLLALQSIDEAQISTIHSFCQGVLRRYAFQSGMSFGAELMTNQDTLVEASVQDFWRKTMYRSSAGFLNYAFTEAKLSIHHLIKMVKSHLGNPFVEIAPDKPLHIEDVEALYQQWCLDYIDLKAIWDQDHDALTELVRTGVKSPSNTAINSMQAYFFWDTPGMDLNLTHFNQYLPTKKVVSHPFIAKATQFREDFLALDTAFSDQLLHLYHELFVYVRQRLSQFKSSRNKMSFDDLLLNLHAALHAEQGETLAKTLHENYPVALIDEFQDTDRVQYEIFQKIYAQAPQDCGVYLIGDPKQSIYRFRGADIFTYRNATARQNEQKTLDTNWRSQQGVIQAIETLFTQCDSPFQLGDSDLPEIQFKPVAYAASIQKKQLTLDGHLFPAMPFWVVGERGEPIAITRKIIAEKVAFEISDLLSQSQAGRLKIGDQPVLAKDITILVRKNAEAQVILEALTECGIPAVVYSQQNVFDSWEAEEVQLILMAIEKPGFDHFLKMALTTDLMGFQGHQLIDFVHDERQWEDWIDRFRNYHHLWLDQGFTAMWQRFLSEENIFAQLAPFQDAERRITNLRQISALLFEQSPDQQVGMSGLIGWLKTQRQQISPPEDDTPEELASDQNAVKILTIHRSKGLEFPIVFCPFLWSGRSRATAVVDYYDAKKETLMLYVGHDDKQKKAANALKSQQLHAEDMRLAYVAMTRAKYACYLTWHYAGKKTCEWSALGYLLGIAKRAVSEAEELSILQALCHRSQQHIQLQDPPREPAAYIAPLLTESSLKHFGGKAYSPWRITSFSGLTAQAHGAYLALKAQDKLQDKDHDDADEYPQQEDSPEDNLDIFHFPGGSQMGNFFHHLFEHVDFAANETLLSRYVQAQCQAFNIDLKWLPCLAEMMFQSLNTRLLASEPDLCLAILEPEHCLIEMEFYFPLSPIQASGLQAIFTTHSQYDLNGLQFNQVEGMLKGFVDLIFAFKGKYYVLDYKSNHLGHQRADYHKDQLTPVMIHSQYILQYHIYTVALYRYLQRRLPDFDYQRHMGGSLYLFLRGLHTDFGAEYGVFYDLPSEALISALSDYFTQEFER